MRPVLVAVGLLLATGCGLGEQGAAEPGAAEEINYNYDPFGTRVEWTDVYDPFGDWGLASLEEMIAVSPIIVRATFNSVKPVGVRSVFSVVRPPGREWQYNGFVGSLEFTFDVIEYLKGRGGSQVRGVAYGHDGVRRLVSETAEQAAGLARTLLETRDNRWDDREAIVFLREAPNIGNELDHHWLGEVSSLQNSQRQVTIASAEARAWLPDTKYNTIEQRFLQDEPTSKTPTITLSALKAKIADIESAEDDSDCAAQHLETNEMGFSGLSAARLIFHEEIVRVNQLRYGYGPVFHHDDGLRTNHLRRFGHMPFGFGHVPEVVRSDQREDEDQPEEFRLEGEDAHLVVYVYPGYAYARRPLPAGEYRFFISICKGYPKNMKGIYENVVKMSAPGGALAESFFDPVADGTAVTGTTTVGTIRWETADGVVSWEVDNVDATQLLTLEYFLDFITLDGSTLLSLAVADAKEVGGAHLWRMESQPWSSGDQLMLRIRGPVPPKFKNVSHHMSIPQDMDIGKSIGSVLAIDPNGSRVSYAITSGNEGHSFAINADTGEITVRQSLDHWAIPVYNLTVKAANEGGGTATVPVTVYVRIR